MVRRMTLDNDFVDFGKRLMLIREMRCLSRTDLATKMGVNRRTIYNWEHMIYRPKGYADYLRLSEIFGVPLTFWSNPKLTENDIIHC